GFMAITWLAQSMAHSQASVGAQYVGLGLYVVAQALIFWPLIWLVTTLPNMTGVLPQAIVLTLALAAGLTMSVFITKADFSWMRSALCVGGWVALGLILVSLGVFFIIGMIALMCGFILYETSNVLHHYNTNQHVAASLAIFASLATLFWYVIRLLMSMRE
ncbi:MAG TPA: Bax inhibitor-1 family protein, partial [Gemmatales bacterium]|nr:Bax inhibitor-1 family protein [Gemmatales bacterium]